MKQYFLLVCSLLPILLAAQSITLNGRVLQAGSHTPLAGATVSAGSNSTVANAAGEFSIAVKSLPVKLVARHTDFDSVLLVVNNTRFITLLLQPAAKQLEEVQVTTGYQLLPKERATGSFETIDNKLLNRAVGTDVLARLEGVTGGLYFNRTRGSRELNVRGLSTFNAGTEPLIVLDNFVYDGRLENIDPDNIEKVTLLRDAAAASIWGARASNGVLIITSKKGNYNQPVNISLNMVVSMQGKPALQHSRDYMRSADFIMVEQQLFANGYYDADLANTFTYPVVSPVVELLAKKRAGQLTDAALQQALQQYGSIDVRNDYQRYLYRKAFTQQYSASIGGSGHNMHYMLGLGYDNSSSNLAGNAGSRANISSQLAIKLLPKMEWQLGLTCTQAADDYNGIAQLVPGGGKFNAYPYAQLATAGGEALPLVQDYRSGYTDTAGGGMLLNWQYRPLDELQNADNRVSRNDLLLRTGLQLDAAKGLQINLQGQLQRTAETSSYYYSQQTYYARNLINRFSQRAGNTIKRNIPLGGILNQNYRNLLSAGARVQLNYSRAIAKNGKVTALAGAEARGVEASGQSTRSYGYNKELLATVPVDYNTLYSLWDNLGQENIENGNGFTGTDNRFVSLYTNAGYNHKNRYDVSASLRKDASNLFGVHTNQKWNPFWSAGLGWKLSSEPFYKLPWLPLLKLRFSYGYSGNINAGASAKAVISFRQNTVIPAPYATVSTPANPGLRWESTATCNTGIDFATKHNRISGSFDWYIKNSSDLFGPVTVDPTTGFLSVQYNAASLRSRGFNLRLNAVPVNRKIKWETQLLLDHVRNTVTKYNYALASKGSYVGFGYGITTPVEGHDPYAIISYRWAGLDGQNGDPQGYSNGAVSKNYATLTRPASMDDLIFSGSTRPAFYGSLRHTLGWKNLSLTINFGYAFAYKFRRSTISYYALYSSWGMNSDFEKRWQQSGDEAHTSIPSMTYPANSQRDNFYAYSEATVEKGDHIRIRDIGINYKPWLSKMRWLANMELYGYANNIGIIWRANKLGIDPDYGTSIPAPVTVSVGVRSNF